MIIKLASTVTKIIIFPAVVFTYFMEMIFEGMLKGTMYASNMMDNIREVMRNGNGK